MKFLIAGLKAWPLHHEIEHFLGHALRADGHEVLFLGCSLDGMSACECVDRAIHQRHGGHRAFCASCCLEQGGVHARAGFTEVSIPVDALFEKDMRLALEGMIVEALLDLPVAGLRLGEVAGPSLMRWARSGRPIHQNVPVEVVREHASQALRLERHLPELLVREGVDAVLVLNALFLSERVVAEVARGLGLRVVNYERGHARNTLLFSSAEPACFLETSPSVEESTECGGDLLLEAYLDGRAGNRDASTRFGTGVENNFAQISHRPLVAVLTNVCWDSAVSARATVFGTYFAWLEAVLELARQRVDLDFVLRVHPGEARLHLDPTLDRTEAWLKERDIPGNLRIIGAEDAESTVALMRQAAATLVFVTTAGLERACEGGAVVTCGQVHYAGKGFTFDCPSPTELDATLDHALANPMDLKRAKHARNYASRLFLDMPVPFPWVDEVEYGRPQRVAATPTRESLERDPLLKRLVGFLAGREARPHSLRELLTHPQLCPLPFHFGSRLAPSASIGVLITAHNRPQVMTKTLEAWAAQDADPARYRLLVVDDGSSPPLETVLRDAMERLREAGPVPVVELMRLDSCGGPARARNAGLNHFSSLDEAPTHVLITGDDMLPEPDVVTAVLADLQAWDDARVAVLGKVEWAHHLGHSRVMRLVERNGMQFGFNALPGRCRLPAQYFYTSSLCLPLDFLGKHGLRFAEDFPFAAWEDVEFGVRAREAGMVLAYNSAIRFHHDHPTDYASFAERQRKAGACSRVFHGRRPAEHAAICGAPPADPPDRQRMRGLESGLAELSKLELGKLQGIPGAQDQSLAGQLDREQDRMLETLFRLHSDAGWFSAPPLPEGPGRPGLLSVLIPVHGQAHLTEACLKALQEAGGGPMEIIVVDNGSTDGTRELLEAKPWVRSHRVDRNLGFARATNLAARLAQGEFLVLLNNDTEVRPGWDSAIRDELARPGTGAVGLRLLYPDGSIQHAGLVFGPDGLPWHVYRGFPATAPEVMRRRSLHAVTGACMALRRETWQAVGALDENYINCYEDVDLCLRLRQMGLEVIYRPDGCVVHHEGRTEGRGNHVTHSWLVLQERWAGRLPCDEDAFLAEDGWQSVRREGNLTLKRLASAPDAQKELAIALQLLESGKSAQARLHLERALPRLDAVNRREVRQLLRQISPVAGDIGILPAHATDAGAGPS